MFPKDFFTAQTTYNITDIASNAYQMKLVRSFAVSSLCALYLFDWHQASASATAEDGGSSRSSTGLVARPTAVPQKEDDGSGCSAQPSFSFDQLWNLQKTFLDNFMYPANIEQAKMINSTLMAPDVKGRVDLTRTFDGPELNTEYRFGLFSNLAINPSTVTLLGYPTKYSVIHFSANRNIASAATIIDFFSPAVNLSVPVQIDTWNMFNKDGQILQYDATFRWFQYLFDTLIAIAMKKFGVPTQEQMIATFQNQIAQGIYNNHELHCKDVNVQYKSTEACMDFLTEQTRFGQAYELGADTLVCRMVHENMIPFRPDVHCPHIGPSGGGMCVDDYTYQSKVLEPFFTHAPFVPYGFHNAISTIAAM